VGFWIDTEWAEIRKELEERLDYQKFEVLFCDGGPGIEESLFDKGELVKDPNGRLVRGPLDRIVVMEKRTGWGVEYPDDLRNGEWEYARFLPDGRRDPKADIKGCFVCHKPKSDHDFVFTWPQLIRMLR
jgi:hypothetical protein